MSWLTSSHWSALAGYASNSHVQAPHHDVRLPARTCPTASDGLWSFGFRRCTMATSLFCQPTTPQCTMLLVQFICPAGFYVSGPLAWSSLPHYVRDESIDTFRQHLKTFLFASYWCIHHIRGFLTIMHYVNLHWHWQCSLTCGSWKAGDKVSVQLIWLRLRRWRSAWSIRVNISLTSHSTTHYTSFQERSSQSVLWFS